MGPLDRYILSEDALKASDAGFELQFQSHWYRALALSCMEFSLKINDEEIDKKTISVQANDKVFPYSQLLELDKEFLFILDKATLQAPKKLEIGKPYKVEFNLDLHIPYILIGPQSKPLLAGSLTKKTLICQ